MGGCPKLQTVTLGSIVEGSMRAVVAGHWFPQVVRPVWVFWLVRLMALMDRARHIVIEEPGRNLVSDDRFYGGHPDVQLATLVMRGPHDGSGGDFRLVDRANRLRFVRHPIPDPFELRGIQARQFHNRQPNLASV